MVQRTSVIAGASGIICAIAILVLIGLSQGVSTSVNNVGEAIAGSAVPITSGTTSTSVPAVAVESMSSSTAPENTSISTLTTVPNATMLTSTPTNNSEAMVETSGSATSATTDASSQVPLSSAAPSNLGSIFGALHAPNNSPQTVGNPVTSLGSLVIIGVVSVVISFGVAFVMSRRVENGSQK